MSVRVRAPRQHRGRDEPYDTSILGRVRNYFRAWVSPANRESDDTTSDAATHALVDDVDAQEAIARAAHRRMYEERLVSVAPPPDAASRFADSLASQPASASLTASLYAYPQTPQLSNGAAGAAAAAAASVYSSTFPARSLPADSVAASSPLKKRTRDEAHINDDNTDSNLTANTNTTNGHSLPATPAPATFEFVLTPTKRRLVASNATAPDAPAGTMTPATASRSVHDILSALDKLTSPLVEAARAPRPAHTPSPPNSAARAPRPAITHPLRASAISIDLSPPRQQRFGLDDADVDDNAAAATPASELGSASPPPTASLDTRSGGMPADVPTRVASDSARAAYTPQSGLRLPPTVLAARWASERAAKGSAQAPSLVDTPRPASARAAAAESIATPVATPLARVRESPLLPVAPVMPTTPSRASPRAQPPAVVVARDAAALSSANDSLCDGERLTSRVRDALSAGTTSGMRDGWLLALGTLDKSLRKDSLLLDSISTEALLEARTETATSITKLIADIGKLTERVTALPAVTATVPAATITVASTAATSSVGADVFKVPPPLLKATKPKGADDGAGKGWKCVCCNTDNDAAAKTCSVCSAAKPSAAETAASVAENAAASAAASAVAAAAAAPKKKVTFAVGDGKTDTDDKSDEVTEAAVKKALFSITSSTNTGDTADTAKSSDQPKTDKPAFQFGSTADKDKDKGSDGGGTKKPVFQFGAGATPPTTPSAGATADLSTPVTKAPVFQFGSGGDKSKRSSPLDSSQPKFGSISMSNADSSATTATPTPTPTPPVDAAAATPTKAPVFAFGKSSTGTDATPAAATPAAATPAGKPVFQFGATPTPATASPPTTAPPTGGARVFQFGAGSATPAAATPAATPSTPSSGGLVKAPSFQFGSSATPAAATSTPASTGAAKPFQFGAGAAASSTPTPAATPAFQFGATGGAAATPTPTGSAKPFQFGASAGTGGATPTTGATSGGGAPVFQFGASGGGAAAATGGGATAASGSGAPAFQFGSGAKPPTGTGGAFGFGAAAAAGSTPAAANPFGGAAATPAAGSSPAFGFGAAAAFGSGSFGSAGGGAPAFGSASQGSPGGEGEDTNSPFSFRPGIPGRKRIVARGRKK